MSGRIAVQVAPKPACLTLDSVSSEKITGGKWVGASQSINIYGAVIDSRAVTAECLFACIAGAHHDGHDFAQTAVGDGAVLILASRMLKLPVPVLVVPDVTAALGALAGEFRRRYPNTCTWIGVGGANGKTTTKALIAAACEADAPGAVHATRGNMNNQLGVPLTILATPPNRRYAVIELGANHPGEITDLAAIAQPQIGVLVSIGAEHLEGFGDLIGVTRSECELFAALPANAPAFIGMAGLQETALAQGTSEAVLRQIIEQTASGRQLIEIGGTHAQARPIHGQADQSGVLLETPAGSARLKVLGHHNLVNATLAYHVVVAAGGKPDAVIKGLSLAAPVAGRLVPRPFKQHLFLDDTYNANPASMAAGLTVLASYSGKRLAVLGGMGELGAASDKSHIEVGALVAQLGLPLVTVGVDGRHIANGYQAANGLQLHHADDRMTGLAVVREQLRSGPHTVLFKASRSVGLDLLMRALLEGGEA